MDAGTDIHFHHKFLDRQLVLAIGVVELELANPDQEVALEVVAVVEWVVVPLGDSLMDYNPNKMGYKLYGENIPLIKPDVG